MQCDEGYRCEICGEDVSSILESELYLKFVLGEVPLEKLHLQAERHIRCHPELAQYIVDPAFPAVCCAGPFDKTTLDSAFVQAEEVRITTAWRRLSLLPTLSGKWMELPSVSVQEQ